MAMHDAAHNPGRTLGGTGHVAEAQNGGLFRLLITILEIRRKRLKLSKNHVGDLENAIRKLLAVSLRHFEHYDAKILI